VKTGCNQNRRKGRWSTGPRCQKRDVHLVIDQFGCHVAQKQVSPHHRNCHTCCEWSNLPKESRGRGGNVKKAPKTCTKRKDKNPKSKFSRHSRQMQRAGNGGYRRGERPLGGGACRGGLHRAMKSCQKRTRVLVTLGQGTRYSEKLAPIKLELKGTKATDSAREKRARNKNLIINTKCWLRGKGTLKSKC